MEDQSIKYKRFMVFEYANYYPSGGLSDVEQSFDTLDEAKEYCEELSKPPKWRLKCDYYEVFDRVEGVTVFTS